MGERFSRWFSRLAIQSKLNQILINLAYMEARLMSAISDYVARVEAKLDTISVGLDGITGDIAALKALIEQLQSTPGAITPEDQALLDQMEVIVGGLADRTSALDAETPPPPTP